MFKKVSFKSVIFKNMLRKLQFFLINGFKCEKNNKESCVIMFSGLKRN